MEVSNRTDGGVSGSGQSSWLLLGLLGISGVLLLSTFWSGLAEMVHRWSTSDEYSHGFFIPVISAFLIWQKRDELARLRLHPSWIGVLAVSLGVVAFVMGHLSTLHVIVQYSFLLTLYGMVLALGGWPLVRIVWAPLIFLIFMVPLPSFLYNNLSQELQLISSQIGVWVIRLFGISVFLEGNVIDLGSYKLQVVEACSGLRYLFSLASLGFLCAYLFEGPLWKRAVIFLSAAPITVFMNSFRIGVTGVLVEYSGIEHAEGFLHDFEGLVIFIAAMGVLIVEMAILARIGRHKGRLREIFGAALLKPAGKSGRSSAPQRPPVTFYASLGVLVVALGVSFALAERQEIVPERLSFAEFPGDLQGWSGKRDALEQKYLDALVLDDYIMADFVNGDREAVNFYIAYYESQRAGESAHSPRSCLPGGGWEIKSLEPTTVDGVQYNGSPLRVNRVVIQMGDVKQLVYYWFQQRGRGLTNEYLVKWYLFWDALTKNRTDGALVRLTTMVRPGEDVAEGDKRLTAFARAVVPELPKYIPN